MARTTETWVNYAEALAFIGNSLLAPMNQTGTVGLEPAFWESFPAFDDVKVALALEKCQAYAAEAQALAAEGGDAVQRESVEYTKLFVGPPHPAAAPWETMHRGEGASVGFGEATFEMQRLLREAGLEVSNENNQYADHIGIELLLLSELVRKSAESGDLSEPRRFANERLLPWVGRFTAAVSAEASGGYYAGIAALASSLCIAFAAHAEG